VVDTFRTWKSQLTPNAAGVEQQQNQRPTLLRPANAAVTYLQNRLEKAEGGKSVNAKRFALLLATFVLIPLGLLAQEKYVPKPNEELYGTWIMVKGDFPKMINLLGKREQFFSADASTPIQELAVEIEKKWKDSDGNVFFQDFCTVTKGPYEGRMFQELDKISESGKKWEIMWGFVGQFDSASFPKKIDPTDHSYGQYERSANWRLLLTVATIQ
jgi:hypothetical protein